MSVTVKLFATIATLCLLHRCYRCVRRWSRLYQRAKYMNQNVPSVQPHWLWGNVFDNPGIFQAGLDWHIKAVSRCRRMLVYWGFWTPCLILNHPDTMKEILKSSTISRRPAGRTGYHILGEWLGQGIATSDGSHWRRNRKLVMPFFQSNCIRKHHVPVINKATDILLDKLAIKADSATPFDFSHMMFNLSGDIIYRVALSHELGCQQGGSPVLDSLNVLTEIGTSRILNPIMANDFLFRMTSKYNMWIEALEVVNKLSEQLIQERRRQHTQESCEAATKSSDLLDTLLLSTYSDGKRLTHREIRDEVNTCIFGGVDTTGSALTWFFMDIAKHPDHQTQVQEEIDNALRDHSEDGTDCYDEHKLPYLMQCVRESLRLHAMLMPARALLGPLTVEGVTIPPKTGVMIDFYQLHHNPDIWGEDHMEFHPERFDQEISAKRDPHAFLPFSIGPHQCIGQKIAMQELKIIAIRVLRRFSLRLVKEAKTKFRIVGKPASEVVLAIRHRKGPDI
ncbi:cytochrome P450 4F12-like [Lytechinus pictus]|uniref:cytochrome P450 4F12-like n=1 Tax=Lytechinus pictus TaxID=7653 RepID=UPI0030BA2955